MGSASGSSSTNQAFVSEEEKAPGPSTDKPAAAAKEKQHWSGVARGAEFQKTVDQLGAKKDQSITVRLQRDESHGRSFSLEASFAWAPAAPQADCKQQLEQCVRGARGAVLVKEKLNPASKKEKQGTLSFKSSTQTPPPPPDPTRPPPPAETATRPRQPPAAGQDCHPPPAEIPTPLPRGGQPAVDSVDVLKVGCTVVRCR